MKMRMMMMVVVVGEADNRDEGDDNGLIMV